MHYSVLTAEATDAQGSERVPIGRPIANTQVYILDAYGEPVPVGVSGELYIGGAGVARGYLNRPELTEERFLPDPFSSSPGARMYRSGDLGRWRSDGNIEFLGRNDFQVKIRGFRIELGEIESRLAAYPGVRDAVVSAWEGEAGDKRLVAYYTVPEGSAAGESLPVEDLRRFLAEKLPEYMVPAAYVRMDMLPLTGNGKLDRKALPSPDEGAFARPGYEPPLGETERRLAAIWADLLKLDQVGRHDNFFDLGGHSLLAVRVVSRLHRDLGAEVPLATLFTYPVLSEFARYLGTVVTEELSPLPLADRSGRLPLSLAQQRLWFLAQMEGGNQAYNIPFGLRLTGGVDRAALRRALNRIVARHEALRTTFVMLDGDPVQQITPEQDSQFLLLEQDLSQAADPERALGRLVAEEGSAPFDLERGPLVRGRLLHLGGAEWALLITMHHIVSDGWSMGIFKNELSTLYSAFHNGLPDPLHPLGIQYADYAVWQRKWLAGDRLQQQAAYWKSTLSGAPALLELPADHPRPFQQDYRGDSVGLVLDRDLTAALKQLSRRHGTTMFMTMLAAWAVLLARLSGQRDIVIGTPSANRGRTEAEGLIGFFVNTLALRLDLSGSPTVAEVLAQARAQSIAAQQQQDIPFEQVVELLQPVRNLSHTPLFQAMFAWQNSMTTGRSSCPVWSRKRWGTRAAPVAKHDLTPFHGGSGRSAQGWT